MTDLATIDIVGFWIGIFLTLCILSFLYKDNPFYKLGEHLFIGTSLGYIIITQWQTNLVPKLIDGFDLLKLVPLAMVAMMFVKLLSRQWGWLGRYPLAFVISLTAGLQINLIAESDLGVQMRFSAETLDRPKIDLNHAELAQLTSLPGVTPGVADKLVTERDDRRFVSLDDALTRPSLTPAERADLASKRGRFLGLDARASASPGQRNLFGVFSSVLLLLGMLASLLYFYFSVAHKGVVGKISRFGVWTLMVGFGASFGYTVQGRIALAIGRAQDIRGTFRDPRDAAQIQGPLVAIISAAIIIVGLVLWELRNKRAAATAGTP